MKPKRRATFSPTRSPAGSSVSVPFSPRPKRKRLESTSPVRRKSSTSSDEVKPPPEFKPFPYKEVCPKFVSLVEKDFDDTQFEKDDLLVLQHELESMLAHSADYLRRAHGEVIFLNTGDYPTQDLRCRPMPSFKLREAIPLSPTTSQEREGLCGLPEDDTEDNVDIWPPHNIPQRFWTWCKADFLEHIDAEYLREFKSQLIDKYSSDALKDYFVNEPWKYRKRANGRVRITSGDNALSCIRGKRKTSVDHGDKKSRDRDTTFSKDKESNLKKSNSSSRSRETKITPLIGDVVNAVCREMRKDEFATPLRRQSVRLHSREDIDLERKLSIKTEPSDAIGVDPIEINIESETDGLGVSPNCPQLESPRMTIKKEPRDEDDWEKAGPSQPIMNGRCNGEIKSKTRKNGEIKRENGVGHGHLAKTSSSSTLESTILDDEEQERMYRDIGGRMVQLLIDKGVIPASTAHVYEEIASCKVEETEVVISEEGRDEADDPEMDEVSEELLRCQNELKDLEPTLRGVISHCWAKIRADFAYWETSDQLDEADHDIFRLGVNMFREVPRRVPTSAEMPTVKTALRRRNGKARLHYGGKYKRMPKYRVENAEEK